MIGCGARRQRDTQEVAALIVKENRFARVCFFAISGPLSIDEFVLTNPIIRHVRSRLSLL